MKRNIAAIALGLSVVAWPTASPVAADYNKGTGVAEVIQGTVTVQSVDVPNRLLTVKDEAGRVTTLDVPPSAKNFARIKAGDQINLRYKAALVAELKKPGEASKTIETRESTATAPEGGKPGGVAQRTVKTAITVKSVDTEKNTLTFVGPKATRTVAVVDPEMQAKLRQLKPGDELEVTYIEALAIDVQPAKP